MRATITSIAYTPENQHEKSTGCYDRQLIESAYLQVGRGIVGDRKGKGKPGRQLNVMTRETLDQLAREGFQTAPGQLGEQIIVSGLDIDALKSGDHVQFGESAVIEIVKPRTGCSKFKAIQSKEPAAAANRLGMMAKVIADGPIAIGCAVRLIAPETTP